MVLICPLDFELCINSFMPSKCVHQEGPLHLPVGIVTFWKFQKILFFSSLLFTYDCFWGIVNYMNIPMLMTCRSIALLQVVFLNKFKFCAVSADLLS